MLRGLIERDRQLLGLLSQTAYAAILKTFQAFFDRPDVLPGCRTASRILSATQASTRLAEIAENFFRQ